MKNYKTFFAAAILFAILTAIVAAYGYNTVAGVVDVVVAKRDIKADEPMLPEALGYGKTPKGAVVSDTVRNPAELQGMVAKGFIPAGTVVRKSMFQAVSTAGARAKLELGYVALAFNKDIDTSCSDQILPNSLVNIKSFNKDGTVVDVASEIRVICVTEKGMVLAIPEEISGEVIMQKNIGTIVFELLPQKEGE